MIEHSVELDKLATALAKAQTVIATAKRESKNPFFQSSYADLASVWEACREALTSNGLSVAQFPGFHDGVATVDTMLLHSSGQWLQATAGAPIAKQDAQGVGSALTYLRRYALAAVASVSPADDDGNAASSAKRARYGVPAGNPDQHGVVPPKERGGTSPTPPKGVAATPGASSAPTSPPSESLNDKPRAIADAEKEPAPWSAEAREWKGKPLGAHSSEDLLALRKFGEKKGPEKYPNLVEQIDEVLAGRGGE